MKMMLPVCVVCEAEGRATLATIVHHVHPIREGGDVLPADDGLLPVCAACHARVEGMGERWREVVRANGST